MTSPETIHFLNVRVDNLTWDVALNKVEKLIRDSKKDQKTRQLFFTNVHSIYLARRDLDLHYCIQNADLVLPDGSGLKIAGNLLEKPVLDNLNGTDFTPKVCEMAEKNGWSVYLLGAKKNVVDGCEENLRKQFPDLTIKGKHDGYFSEEEEQEIIKDINSKKPEILLVAMGSPLQEKWIAKHAPDLNVAICFAVGGLFDFLSDTKERAPLWMRKAGIEWVHRFFEDPRGKWKRIFIEIPVYLTQIILKRILHPQLNNQRD